MSGQSVQPSKRSGTKGKEEEDGWASETLVLDVFWRIRGSWFGMGDAFVVFQYAAAFSKRISALRAGWTCRLTWLHGQGHVA